MTELIVFDGRIIQIVIRDSQVLREYRHPTIFTAFGMKIERIKSYSGVGQQTKHFKWLAGYINDG